MTNKHLTINTLRPCIVLFRGPSLRFVAAPPMRTAAPCSGRQVSLDGHVFSQPERTRLSRAQEGRRGEGAFLPPFFSPLAPLPPFTNPLTPDSENRWRGKWGFGAEEFTVSRETFTSIWVAHATFWNPIVTFQLPEGGQWEFTFRWARRTNAFCARGWKRRGDNL